MTIPKPAPVDDDTVAMIMFEEVPLEFGSINIGLFSGWAEIDCDGHITQLHIEQSGTDQLAAMPVIYPAQALNYRVAHAISESIADRYRIEIDRAVSGWHADRHARAADYSRDRMKHGEPVL